MGRVILDVSISLDGFLAGPHDEIEPLHDWLADGTAVAGARLLEELLARTGAVVMGRRTFDLVDGPDGWTSPDGTPFALPVVVVTSAPRPAVTKGSTSFTFVAGGVEQALAEARPTAGDKDVAVMGAEVAQQFLRAGLLDEVVLHLVPVLLGTGIRLFGDLPDGPVALHQTAVLVDPRVSHHRFDVVR